MQKHEQNSIQKQCGGSKMMWRTEKELEGKREEIRGSGGNYLGGQSEDGREPAGLRDFSAVDTWSNLDTALGFKQVSYIYRTLFLPLTNQVPSSPCSGHSNGTYCLVSLCSGTVPKSLWGYQCRRAWSSSITNLPLVV